MAKTSNIALAAIVVGGLVLAAWFFTRRGGNGGNGRVPTFPFEPFPGPFNGFHDPKPPGPDPTVTNPISRFARATAIGAAEIGIGTGVGIFAARAGRRIPIPRGGFGFWERLRLR